MSTNTFTDEDLSGILPPSVTAPVVIDAPVSPEPVVTAADPAFTKSPRRSRVKAPEGPTFAEAANELATAESVAKSISADAGQARAVRSEKAIATILAAYRGAIPDDEIRNALLDAGVLKGTVSKIITIVNALQSRTIEPGDLKSLNGAYGLVKSVQSATAATIAGQSTNNTATAFAAPTPAVVATSPEEAMQIIVTAVLSVNDPDERFKLGGEWITKFTTKISDALNGASEGEED